MNDIRAQENKLDFGAIGRGIVDRLAFEWARIYHRNEGDYGPALVKLFAQEVAPAIEVGLAKNAPLSKEEVEAIHKYEAGLRQKAKYDWETANMIVAEKDILRERAWVAWQALGLSQRHFTEAGATIPEAAAYGKALDAKKEAECRREMAYAEYMAVCRVDYQTKRGTFISEEP